MSKPKYITQSNYHKTCLTPSGRFVHNGFGEEHPNFTKQDFLKTKRSYVFYFDWVAKRIMQNK